MLLICTAFKKAMLVLKKNGEVLYKEFDSSMKASESVMPEIEKLLGDYKISDIKTVGVVVGPGSFTGVRIGISFALGFMAANPSLRAVNISSLNLIARSYVEKHAPKSDFVCILSAGSGLYFMGRYFADGRVAEEGKLIGEAEFLRLDEIKVGITDENGVDVSVFPSAHAFIELAEEGERVSADRLRPVYLRLSQAEIGLLEGEYVEEAGIGDIEAIFALSRRKFTDGWTIKQLKESLNSKNDKCFVLKRKGEILAYVNALFSADGIEILSIVSRNEGQGYGTRLLKRLEEESRPLFLEVSEKNETALKFYLKRGFQKVGIRENYYSDGTNAITMKKD